MRFVLYDSQGDAVAYTEDGVHLFLFGGQPVAYLEGSAVYAFGGAQLAHYEAGWVQDHAGAALFFSDRRSGPGPQSPILRPVPGPAPRQPLPQKWARQPARVRPVNQLRWSSRSGPGFFLAAAER